MVGSLFVILLFSNLHCSFSRKLPLFCAHYICRIKMDKNDEKHAENRMLIRDRPFNLKGGGYGFLFRSEIFFPTTQELEYIFFCRASRI